MSQALNASAIAQYQDVLTQLSESLEAHKAPTSLDEPFDELFEARMAKLEVTSAMGHLKRLHELVEKREAAQLNAVARGGSAYDYDMREVKA